MKVGSKITESMKQDIIASWSEAEEITANFEQMTKEEIIDCLNSIKSRATKIRDTLYQYITDDEVFEYNENS